MSRDTKKKEVEQLQQTLADKKTAPLKPESRTRKYLRWVITYGMLILILLVVIMAFLNRGK